MIISRNVLFIATFTLSALNPYALDAMERSSHNLSFFANQPSTLFDTIEQLYQTHTSAQIANTIQITLTNNRLTLFEIQNFLECSLLACDRIVVIDVLLLVVKNGEFKLSNSVIKNLKNKYESMLDPYLAIESLHDSAIDQESPLSIIEAILSAIGDIPLTFGRNSNH